MGAPSQVAAPRIVLDTNIVLSALMFGADRWAWLRLAWQSGRVVPLATADTTRELLRVLSYPKFKLTREQQQELCGDYLPWVEVVMVPSPGPAVPICRDLDDGMFLQLALVGRASYLVTGDEDLLSLRPGFSVPIIAAASLRRLLME